MRRITGGFDDRHHIRYRSCGGISLAHRGYRIFAVGRDANWGVGVVDELERVGAGGEFLPCDLLDLADVRRLAHVLTERYRHLDVLLNNAGGTFRAKALTQDGIERTFALYVVAPYALTAAPLSPPSRRRASCKRRHPGIGTHPS